MDEWGDDKDQDLNLEIVGTSIPIHQQTQRIQIPLE
jgi:hypothetical protein